MFEPASRYAKLKTRTITVTGGDGQPVEVRYVARRFIPPGDDLTTLVEHAVAQGERLDGIAARYLGDPTQFWRICDANDALDPEELTDEVGRIIKIAQPDL